MQLDIFSITTGILTLETDGLYQLYTRLLAQLLLSHLKER